MHALLIETPPTPAELKSVQIGGDTTGSVGAVAQVSEIVVALRPTRDC
ncbi:hypothetical protein [Nocardia sp. NPDC059228]